MNYDFHIVDSPAYFDDVIAKLDNECILAVDTETVGVLAERLWKAHALLVQATEFWTKQAIRGDTPKDYNRIIKVATRCQRKAKKVADRASKNPGALDFWRNKLSCIQLGYERSKDDYVVYLIRPACVDARKLSSLLNSRRMLIFQNAKFDWKQLKRHLNIDLHCLNLYDTSISEYLINSGKELQSSLKEIVRRRFGYVMDKSVALSNWSGHWTPTMCKYAAEDVAYLFKIKEAQREDLYSLKLDSLRRMETKLTTAVGRMEMNGLGLDYQLLCKDMKHYEGEYAKAEIRARLMLQGANPASPVQVKAALCGFGIEVASVDKKNLKPFADDSRVQAVQEFKTVHKTLTTYYRPLHERAVLIAENDYRIFANFNTNKTDTGRLSSSEPNLQNQPAGGDVRKVFVPAQGWRLCIADLSQVEMRILAHVSRDSNLLRAFKDDIDVHTLAAAMVFGIEPEKVEKWQRTWCKAIQFGLVYGKTEHGLSKDLGISKRKAESFIRRYFRIYRGVERFLGETIERAHADGFVRTLAGRVRHLPGLSSNDKWIRAHYERAAANTVIQGTAADGMKASLVYLDNAIQTSQWSESMKLVCNVHDEVLVEYEKVDDPMESAVIAIVRENLIRGTQELIPSVPVKVGNADSGWDPIIVSNWSEGK